jgi:hypothetical protein
MTIKDLQLPLSDYKIGKIGQFYTKEEVDQLIKYAVNEAKRIDEESVRLGKHGSLNYSRFLSINNHLCIPICIITKLFSPILSHNCFI